MTTEYLETQVMTAPPVKLHLMVVDGALRFARAARQALERGDFSEAHLALNRSRDCVTDLIVGLHDQHDPNLISQLKALFLFAYRRMVDADFRHDPREVGDAIRVLELHRQNWLELMQQLPTSGPAPTPHFRPGAPSDQNQPATSSSWVV